MAAPNFYNENLHRAYPFVLGSVGVPGDSGIAGLPNAVIVDAGFVLGLESGFVAGVHSVWLDYAVRSGNLVSFVFRTDAPGVATDGYLVFTRDLAVDTDYATQYADNFSPAALPDDTEAVSLSIYDGSETSDSSATANPEPLWSGFLVTGTLAALTALLPGNGIVMGSLGAGNVEPALLQNLTGSYVAGVGVANTNRTRVTAPAGCPEPVWAFPIGPGVLFVADTGLTGAIVFRAGYNAVVRQDNTLNAVILGAAVGAGLGEPCSEEALFDDEAPLAGGHTLDGSPRCNDVIRSINGVGGTLASLLGGQGVALTTVPEENTIVLDVNLARMTVCYSDISEVSETLA